MNETLTLSKKVINISQSKSYKPKVFIRTTSNFESILEGYIHGVWAGYTDKKNITTYYKNVNIGDYVIVYYTDDQNKIKSRQGFHLVGLVVGKRDPNEIDKLSFSDGEYGCVVDVMWLNKPRKDRFVSLQRAKELTEGSTWNKRLHVQMFNDCTDWDIESEAFRELINVLVKGM